MKNLLDDIVVYLKTLTMPYDMTIRGAYNKLSPVYPLVIVHEIQNATRTAINGQEYLSNVGHQIDIFSTDTIIDLEPVSGIVICRETAQFIDEKLQEQYGLTRESVVELPDVNDGTLARVTLRYTGILDTRTDYMYR